MFKRSFLSCLCCSILSLGINIYGASTPGYHPDLPMSSLRWRVLFYNNQPIKSNYTVDFCDQIMHDFTFDVNNKKMKPVLSSADVRKGITHATMNHMGLDYFDLLTSNETLYLGKGTESFNYRGKDYSTKIIFSYITDMSQRIGKGIYENDYCKGNFVVVIEKKS